MKYIYMFVLVGLTYSSQNFASDTDRATPNTSPSCVMSNGVFYGFLSGLGVGSALCMGIGFGVPVTDYRAEYLLTGTLIGCPVAGAVAGWLIERYACSNNSRRDNGSGRSQTI